MFALKKHVRNLILLVEGGALLHESPDIQTSFVNKISLNR